MYVNSGSDWNRLQVLPYRVDLAGHTMTTRDDSLSTQGEIKSPDGRVNAVISSLGIGTVFAFAAFVMIC
jgi:hypothetical protein